MISIEPLIQWEKYFIKKDYCKDIKRIKGLNGQRQLRYVRNHVASRFSKYPPAEAANDILRNKLSYLETI